MEGILLPVETHLVETSAILDRLVCEIFYSVEIFSTRNLRFDFKFSGMEKDEGVRFTEDCLRRVRGGFSGRVHECSRQDRRGFFSQRSLSFTRRSQSDFRAELAEVTQRSQRVYLDHLSIEIWWKEEVRIAVWCQQGNIFFYVKAAMVWPWFR